MLKMSKRMKDFRNALDLRLNLQVYLYSSEEHMHVGNKMLTLAYNNTRETEAG